MISSAIAHVIAMLAVSAVAVVTVEVAEITVLEAQMFDESDEPPLETLASLIDMPLEDGLDIEEADMLIANAETVDEPTPDEAQPVDFLPMEDQGQSLFGLPAEEEKLVLEMSHDGKSDIDRDAANLPRMQGQAQMDQPPAPAPPAAEYFGTVARGDRFVYVLDRSSSMAGDRFKRAVEELLRSIDQLKADQSFYVVLFSDNMRRMFEDKSPIARLLPATLENRRKIRKWLLSVRSGGGTEPQTAIRFAMALRPSAVFLLSDGEFNGINSRGDLFGANTPTSQYVSDSHTVPIHSFAYEDPNSRANMQALAAMTGGQYRYIKPDSKQPGNRAAPPSPPPQQPAARPQFPWQTPPQPQRQMTPRQQADAMLAAADDLRDQGNYEAAMRTYRTLVSRYPTTPSGAKARGRIVMLWNTIKMAQR